MVGKGTVAHGEVRDPTDHEETIDEGNERANSKLLFVTSLSLPT